MIERIGHFEVDSQLGKGGMGVVYKAHEPSLNRTVAVKVLGEHLAQDKEFVQRFQREAQAAAALNHPNIVQIYSFGEENGKYYFAMEFVNGISVQEMIKQDGSLTPDQAAHVILQAAEGLAAAHDMGMIHRDIKPANLMINRQGLVKIADFGIALRPSDRTRLTSSGMLMGTPGYLSPEQCLDKNVDARTDIYALGVSFFEMLSGRVPFSANSPAALIREIVDGTPMDLSLLRADLPEELKKIVEKMMHKDPDQRYQSCHDIVSDLAGFLQGRSGGIQGIPLLHSAATRNITDPNAGKTTPIDRTPTGPAISSKRMPVLFILLFVFICAVLLSAGGYVLYKSGVLGNTPHTGTADEESSAAEETTDKRIVTKQSEKVTLTGAVEEESGGKPDASSGGEAPRPLTGTQGERQRDDMKSTTAAPKSVSPATADAGQPFPTTIAEPAPASAPAPPAGVIVVALGDPLLGNAIAQDMETLLGNSGIDPLDPYAVPGVQRLIDHSRQSGGDVAALLDALSTRCTTAVVARIEVISQRQLRYYGRTDTAWTADVVVSVYDTVSGSSRGRCCRKRIEYASTGVEALVELEMKECGESVLPAVRAHLEQF